MALLLIHQAPKFTELCFHPALPNSMHGNFPLPSGPLVHHDRTVEMGYFGISQILKVYLQNPTEVTMFMFVGG